MGVGSKEDLIAYYERLNRTEEQLNNLLFDVVQARMANIETMEALIAVGANVNCHHALSGETPLLSALKFHRASFALALIQSGASVHATNNACETPLMMACQLKLASVIDVILAAGADPKACDREGHSALSYAAASGDRALFNRILAFYDVLPLPELKKAACRAKDDVLRHDIHTLVTVTAKQQEMDRVKKALKDGTPLPQTPKRLRLIVKGKHR